MKNVILFAVSVAFLMACKTVSTVTEEVEAVDDAADEATEMPKTPIGEGKLVLLTKCATCHEAPNVDCCSKEKWDKVLPSMIKQAELTEEEANNVSAYIYWELEN